MTPNLQAWISHWSHLVVSQFRFVWVILLAGIVFCGLAATNNQGTPGGEVEGKSSIWPSRLGAQLAKTVVLLFLVACAALTFFRESLHDYDNALLWLVLLLLIALCALVASNRRHPIYAGLRVEEVPAEDRTSLWPAGAADWIAVIALLVLLMIYTVVIFYRQDFVWYDDDVFTDFSLQGKKFAPAIWPDQGRFFPLEVQEFNYVSRVTRSPAGFHSIVLAELILLLAAMAIALREHRVWQRVLLLAAAMAAPSFLISFMGLIYPERNVLFWLAMLVVCLAGYSKTGGAIYFLGCLVATHIALYYKEPVAVFIAGFAVTRLLLENLEKGRGSLSWRALARRNALPLGMLAITGIFAGLFVLTMFPRASGAYVEAHGRTLSSVLWAYAQTDWLLLVLLALFGVRVGRFLLSRGELDALWEPLAVGALGYFLVVLALHLFSGYYTAPVDLIAVLYTGRLALEWLATPTGGRVFVAAAVFLILMVHNTAYSAFRVVETKSLIAAKAQLADYLESHAAGTDTMELFFPYAGRFHLMGFSSYLNYRGMQLAGQKTTAKTAGPRVQIEGRGEYLLDRCVDYRTYVCKHVDSPREGAWIVVMPDDDVSIAEVARAGQGAPLVFSVKACGMCEREGSWLRRLHAISQEYWNQPLPEHWLELHVFHKAPSSDWSRAEGTAIAGAE